MRKNKYFKNVEKNFVNNQHWHKENIKQVKTKFPGSKKTNKNPTLTLTITLIRMFVPVIIIAISYFRISESKPFQTTLQ